MKRLKDLTAVLGMLALTACNNAPIEGSWVEPVPGMPGMQQGFLLEAGGNASSINMATLKYETWRQEGSRLLLSGTSIGNRQSISFTDTLAIEKLTQDSLILKRGGLLLRYARTDEAPGKETVPATPLTPARKLMSVKGELVIGHEVRSFTAEGDSVDYWVDDETGELMQKYDELTQGVKNGKPVYVEMEVIDMGKADDGFAADYASVYQVRKIGKMAAR